MDLPASLGTCESLVSAMIQQESTAANKSRHRHVNLITYVVRSEKFWGYLGDDYLNSARQLMV